MPNGDEPQRHVVVFDCNVYLDVARLLGPPYSWGALTGAAARTAREPVPHPSDRAYDSLRAIAVCQSGRLAGDEGLEVWTNAHIEATVRYKAQQSTTPDPGTGYRGLGWGEADAQTLIDDLIGTIIADSNGGTLGATVPDSNPPLDYEDGMVYGACRWLAGDDPLCNVYCVTRDRNFIKDRQEGRLSGHSRVLSPSAFVESVRKARTLYSVQRMRS